MGVKLTHFQIGTISTILGLSIESHHSSYFIITFTENISIAVVSQRTHEFGMSEKN